MHTSVNSMCFCESCSLSSIPNCIHFWLSCLVCRYIGSQEHKTLSFQIKGDAPLKKLVDKYFEKASVARTLVELIYNGERLQVQRTPDQLGMKDMVEIDAMVHANGGGNQL
ncbi:hypothetical protein QQ045_026645 [Rhodiola kirilowii]